MHRPTISKAFGIGLAALATLVFSGGATRPAVAANNYYTVPIGYTWDHMSYDDNSGDWNLAVGDHGFTSNQITGNKGTSANGPAFTLVNNDPVHGYTGIPFLIGPTTDGFNNVMVAEGQAVPVVPGKYKALYVTYSGVNGPHNKPVILNYTDGNIIRNYTWADWCASSQAPPDFFLWAATHRNGKSGTAADTAGCSLITKYIPVDPNRTLVSVTLGYDSVTAGPSNASTPGKTGGEVLAGDVIQQGNGRTIIGTFTLASDTAGLGGYGTVKGTVFGPDGKTPVQVDAHTGDKGVGAEVVVIAPFIGNYGGGANVDGTYSIGLPPGTYTLSAAIRDPATQPSPGLQATPVTVTIAAGQTVTQNITMLAAPNPALWGSISGQVNDAANLPAAGQYIAIASSQTGPFHAHGLTGQGVTVVGDTSGVSPDGGYQIDGIAPGTYWVKAGSNSSSSTPVQVTVKGGATTNVPNITVSPLPIGSATVTIADPDKNFGGIGQTVTLTSSDGKTTITDTSLAIPTLNNTSVIPEMGETSTVNFDIVPVGDYTVTLQPSASNGTAVTGKLTVTQGQQATLALTSSLPPFIEGTVDTALTDPLKGALASKWTLKDIFFPGDPNAMPAALPTEDPGTKGTAGADGKFATAGNRVNVARTNDQFTFAYQTVPANTDFAATVDVLSVPQSDPTSRIGLMEREDNDNPLAANAYLTASNGQGVKLEGREVTNLGTFPFGETAVGTSPGNMGTSPTLPVSLKMRQVGPVVAGYYSTDGGKTQHYVGAFLPTFQTPNVRLGIAAVTAGMGGLDNAQVSNFRFAKLAGTTPTVVLGDVNGDGKITIADATTVLQWAVKLGTPNANQTIAADVNKDGKIDIKDVTLILKAIVNGTGF